MRFPEFRNLPEHFIHAARAEALEVGRDVGKAGFLDGGDHLPQGLRQASQAGHWPSGLCRACLLLQSGGVSEARGHMAADGTETAFDAAAAVSGLFIEADLVRVYLVV